VRGHGFLALSLLGCLTADSAAQETLRPPEDARVTVSLTAGTLGFGTLQGQPVRVERLGNGNQAPTSVQLRRQVEATGGFHVHGSAALRLTEEWALRLGAGLGRASLDYRYSGEATWADDAAALPLQEADAMRLVSVEAALRFRLPPVREIHPFFEVGAARERWSWQDPGASAGGGDVPLPEAAGRTVGLAGAGADIWITGRLFGRVQLGTRVLQTPVPPGPAGRVTAVGDDLRVSLEAPAAAPFADGAIELVRVLRLDLGLTYSLDPAEDRRRDRSGSAASPSAPGR
jgi:hypothetical protein